MTLTHTFETVQYIISSFPQRILPATSLAVVTVIPLLEEGTEFGDATSNSLDCSLVKPFINYKSDKILRSINCLKIIIT